MLPAHIRYTLYLTHCADQKIASLPRDEWYRRQPEYLGGKTVNESIDSARRQVTSQESDP